MNIHRYSTNHNSFSSHWTAQLDHFLTCLVFKVIFLFLNLSTLTQAQLPTSFSNLRCYRSTNITGACVPLASKLCLGTTLPFTHTSVSLANDSRTVDEVYEKLRLWGGLRNVPQCWAVVQPFLCSVYLPRCNDTQGVELPSKEVCERTRKPCQIVQEVNNGWPDFLQCNSSNFLSGCGETYDKLVFNATGRCEPPLIRTDNPGSWFSGVDGCGVPCDNPLFTPEEHREVHIFVAVFGSLCLTCTLFTVLTFIIDWKNASRYPSLILFFINACFFLGSIGWMSQFVGGARRDIVCRKDGTVRRGEPQLGSNESISCTVVFVIVYYFLVAGVSWFVMLAFAWHLTFTTLGTARDALKSKTAYFHLISWCFPLVLTIVCLAISEIDGDSVSGICFVGVFSHGIRALFVLVPVGMVIIVGAFFLLKGVNTLIKIKKEAPVFIPEKTFSKIRDTILRLGIFTAVALIFVFITFAVHVYIFARESQWRASFRNYMYCLTNISVTAHAACVIEDRPSLVAMEIHIFAFFGAGIAMSSWSWTKASLLAWERFFRWIFHKPSNKPVRLKRHRMIAQAFEKRKEINQGRVSISYCSSHDDPLGMKFDLNSGSDDDLSSNFAMAMPKLVCRRGGLVHPVAGMMRRHSDSDIASVISTRRVSRESQLMEFHEQQFFFIHPNNLLDDVGRRGKKKMKKKKRGRLNRIRPPMGPMFSGLRFGSGRFGGPRKGSDSSALSQMSGHSVWFSVGRNSIETTSLASNVPPEMVLPAVTKRNEREKTSLKMSSKVVPFVDFSPTKKGTDFSIFSAKSDVSRNGKGSVGESNVGQEQNISLPGALEESEPSVVSQQKPQINHPHQQQYYQFQPQRRASVSLADNRPNSPKQMQQKRVLTKTKQRTRTVTVEAQVKEGAIPLHALMADISGGNWGVLLGKSGSSSGSESGGRGVGGYIGGGPGHSYMGAASPYVNGPQLSHLGAYNMPGHEGRSHPYMGGANPYTGGTKSHMGGASPYMGGASPYMGGADPYIGGANPYMGGASPYMGVSSLQMAGARPKVKDQWGHFPYYPSAQSRSSSGARNLERRHARERKKEREMRRPHQTFFNSAFNVVDDYDIESIST